MCFTNVNTFTSNKYQVIERTQNSIANNQKGITPKISKAEFYSVNDTSSRCALQVYEVSLKYLLRFSSYRAVTILRPTD